MNVKSAFLNGYINEEVCVSQPPGFENHKYLNHVFKQATRAWYERLSKFFINQGYLRGKVDTNLFIKLHGNDTLLIQVYVDDIIFRSINM